MKFKRREKLLIFFVTIALAIWGFDYFYYTPQTKKIAHLKEEVKAADLKLKESSIFMRSVETAETEVSRLEKELQGLSERTLKGKEFRAFLKHLAADSDRLQMKMVSLVPSEEKLPAPEGKKAASPLQYRRVRVNLTLHCTFASVEAYLKGIEGLPFLVTVDTLQVERSGEISPYLKVTLGLSVHIIS
jgi:hypothetical protein